MTGRTLNGLKETFTIGWKNRKEIAVGGWRKRSESSICSKVYDKKRIFNKLVDMAMEIFRKNVEHANLLSYLSLIKIEGLTSIKKGILVFKKT